MSGKSKEVAASATGGLGARMTQTITTLLIAMIASGAATFLMQGDQLGRVETVLIAAALIVAILFGLMYGLLAAVVVLAVHAVTGLPPLSVAFSADDAVLLALFGAGVAVTGLYTDAARRGARRPGTLFAARRRSNADGGPAEPTPLSGQPLGKARPASGLKEIQRALAFVFIVACGLAGGWLTRHLMGPPCGLLVLLTSVIVAGGLLGARFGLASGLLTALALATYSGSATGPSLSQAAAGFSVVVFAFLGWGVGRLADELKRQRESLESLVSASRDLSSSNDEAAIRSVLFDSLSKITLVSQVELRDDSGTVLMTTGAAAPPAEPMSKAGRRWRTRRLAADGRDVGEARWRLRAHDKDVAVADEIASSLIDLGAAAIVRARLSAEKAEMEFIARTEHLRTILLDAVSHHFRSPLAGIIGSVTSILSLPEQHDRDVRRELLLIIKEQANRLNRYVDNFLSVARLESGSIDINLKDVSLEPLVYDVWETFGEAGGARRFLRVNVDQQPVRTDDALMTQVLGNLLENAIKFSSEGSVIDVRGVRRDGQVVIEVIDQGCGVPQSSQPRIFDRFFRSPGAKSPGLGLGLYITRSLVEMLGGRVEAHNRSDGESGLVVTLVLPQEETER